MVEHCVERGADVVDVEVGVEHGRHDASVSEVALHLGHPHARSDQLGGEGVPSVGVVASGDAGAGDREADLSFEGGDRAALVGVGQ